MCIHHSLALADMTSPTCIEVPEGIRVKMPCVVGLKDDVNRFPRPLILMKNDYLLPGSHMAWRDRCAYERENGITPNASPRMPK